MKSFRLMSLQSENSRMFKHCTADCSEGGRSEPSSHTPPLLLLTALEQSQRNTYAMGNWFSSAGKDAGATAANTMAASSAEMGERLERAAASHNAAMREMAAAGYAAVSESSVRLERTVDGAGDAVREVAGRAHEAAFRGSAAFEHGTRNLKDGLHGASSAIYDIGHRWADEFSSFRAFVGIIAVALLLHGPVHSTISHLFAILMNDPSGVIWRPQLLFTANSFGRRLIGPTDYGDCEGDRPQSEEQEERKGITGFTILCLMAGTFLACLPLQPQMIYLRSLLILANVVLCLVAVSAKVMDLIGWTKSPLTPKVRSFVAQLTICAIEDVAGGWQASVALVSSFPAQLRVTSAAPTERLELPKLRELETPNGLLEDLASSPASPSPSTMSHFTEAESIPDVEEFEEPTASAVDVDAIDLELEMVRRVEAFDDCRDMESPSLLQHEINAAKQDGQSTRAEALKARRSDVLAEMSRASDADNFERLMKSAAACSEFQQWFADNGNVDYAESARVRNLLIQEDLEDYI